MPRLLLYNIAYGQGFFGKKHQYLEFWRRLAPPKLTFAAMTKAIRKQKPDLVALVEVDASPRKKRNQLQVIKEQVGLPFSDARVKYAYVGIGRAMHWMPYLRNQSNGIISRYPFVEVIYHTLPRGTKRIACQYIIQCGRQRCSVLLVHLPLGLEARHRQLMELLKIIKRIKGPLICLGDFNAPRHELQAFMAATHLTDSHFDLSGEGKSFTFPAHKPSRKIDHILVSHHIRIEKARIFPWQYSDHLPLQLDFSFAPRRVREQARYIVERYDDPARATPPQPL